MDDDAARRRIDGERDRVEGLVAELRGDLGQSDGSADAEHDESAADGATDTFEREKELSILEQLEGELVELQAALERIDAGTYGVDEVTGEPIDPERLEAVPTARTNVGDAPTSAPDDRDPRDVAPDAPI